MDWFRLAIGGFGLIYGAINMIAWAANRQNSTKALAMKKQWGEQRGRLVHGVSYGLLPFLIGIVLVVFGL